MSVSWSVLPLNFSCVREASSRRYALPVCSVSPLVVVDGFLFRLSSRAASSRARLPQFPGRAVQGHPSAAPTRRLRRIRTFRAVTRCWFELRSSCSEQDDQRDEANLTNGDVDSSNRKNVRTDVRRDVRMGVRADIRTDVLTDVRTDICRHVLT